MSSFGGVIPVTGLNLGFLGNVSRLGERVIAARQVLSTTPNAIKFGDPVIIVPDSTGGTYQNVADLIAGAGSFTAAKFAGIAVRNVRTQLVYQTLTTVATPFVGQYNPGEIAEVLERGSTTIKINNGTPVSQAPVFVRIALNGGIPAGVVGGLEAVADGANTIQLTGVVFRTGVLDANGVAEVTLLSRVAA